LPSSDSRYQQLLDAKDRGTLAETLFSPEWGGVRTEYASLWVSNYDTNITGLWKPILPKLRQEFQPVLPFMKAIYRYGEELPLDSLITKDGVLADEAVVRLQAA
jgi:hypothetical protein